MCPAGHTTCHRSGHWTPGAAGRTIDAWRSRCGRPAPTGGPPCSRCCGRPVSRASAGASSSASPGTSSEERSHDQNEGDLRRLVEQGLRPGLVAYDGDDPVGWCAVAPIASLTRIATSPFFAQLRPDGDDTTDRWAITCFVVRESARGQGLVDTLLHASVDVARANGASGLEGYPLDTAKAGDVTPTRSSAARSRPSPRAVSRASPTSVRTARSCCGPSEAACAPGSARPSSWCSRPA